MSPVCQNFCWCLHVCVISGTPELGGSRGFTGQPHGGEMGLQPTGFGYLQVGGCLWKSADGFCSWVSEIEPPQDLGRGCGRSELDVAAGGAHWELIS